MRYFDIATIKNAIERLQNAEANWILPAFVFAANDVGIGTLVDISKRKGTDQFLDRYFNGKRLEIPPFPTGNNLLRPRLKGINWNKGAFAGDHMLRQDTKMWGNLFSSRGYREMRLEGIIEGEKAINALTDDFQPRFEEKIPADFRFEDFLVWLYAFEGVPDEVHSWDDLYKNLLSELDLKSFQPPYLGRFKISTPAVPWPALQANRPTNEEFIQELAPKLAAFLASPPDDTVTKTAKDALLPSDDTTLASIKAAITAGESLSFLLAGPPGTGKTHYARELARVLTSDDDTRSLFLQFHPALGYDDFVEGFRPVADSSGSGVKYELGPRLFLKFAQKAAADPDNVHVAVIDELNRGDIARVFGEMLTYIETDYRGKEFTLPVSNETTSLPKNLVVIATANPMDRSVTDLDDAFLRRFWVIEFEPDGAFLKKYLEDQKIEAGLINRTVQAFTVLNKAFPHGFGHTNFLKVRSIDDLAAVWMGRVRLALKRAYAHDRDAFDAVSTEIENLLRTKDGGETIDADQTEQ